MSLADAGGLRRRQLLFPVCPAIPFLQPLPLPSGFVIIPCLFVIIPFLQPLPRP